MTPEERFRLNPAAKEHRLNKLKRRLEAATPTKARPRAKERQSNFGWVIGVIAVGVFIWWLKRKAHGA